MLHKVTKIVKIGNMQKLLCTTSLRKVEAPVVPTTFKIVERIIYFSPEGYMIEL